jgi:hypothetical protein
MNNSYARDTRQKYVCMYVWTVYTNLTHVFSSARTDNLNIKRCDPSWSDHHHLFHLTTAETTHKLMLVCVRANCVGCGQDTHVQCALVTEARMPTRKEHRIGDAREANSAYGSILFLMHFRLELCLYAAAAYFVAWLRVQCE